MPKIFNQAGESKGRNDQCNESAKGQQKAEAKREEEERQEAESVKKVLEDDKTVVQLTAKAGTDGRLFGSIPSKQIAQALDKQFGIKLISERSNCANQLKLWASLTCPLNYTKMWLLESGFISQKSNLKSIFLGRRQIEFAPTPSFIIARSN